MQPFNFEKTSLMFHSEDELITTTMSTELIDWFFFKFDQLGLDPKIYFKNFLNVMNMDESSLKDELEMLNNGPTIHKLNSKIKIANEKTKKVIYKTKSSEKNNNENLILNDSIQNLSILNINAIKEMKREILKSYFKIKEELKNDSSDLEDVINEFIQRYYKEQDDLNMEESFMTANEDFDTSNESDELYEDAFPALSLLCDQIAAVTITQNTTPSKKTWTSVVLNSTTISESYLQNVLLKDFHKYSKKLDAESFELKENQQSNSNYYQMLNYNNFCDECSANNDNRLYLMPTFMQLNAGKPILRKKDYKDRFQNVVIPMHFKDISNNEDFITNDKVSESFLEDNNSGETRSINMLIEDAFINSIWSHCSHKENIFEDNKSNYSNFCSLLNDLNHPNDDNINYEFEDLNFLLQNNSESSNFDFHELNKMSNNVINILPAFLQLLTENSPLNLYQNIWKFNPNFDVQNHQRELKIMDESISKNFNNEIVDASQDTINNSNIKDQSLMINHNKNIDASNYSCKFDSNFLGEAAKLLPDEIKNQFGNHLRKKSSSHFQSKMTNLAEPNYNWNCSDEHFKKILEFCNRKVQFENENNLDTKYLDTKYNYDNEMHELLSIANQCALYVLDTTETLIDERDLISFVDEIDSPECKSIDYKNIYSLDAKSLESHLNCYTNLDFHYSKDYLWMNKIKNDDIKYSNDPDFCKITKIDNSDDFIIKNHLNIERSCYSEINTKINNKNMDYRYTSSKSKPVRRSLMKEFWENIEKFKKSQNEKLKSNSCSKLDGFEFLKDDQNALKFSSPILSDFDKYSIDFSDDSLEKEYNRDSTDDEIWSLDEYTQAAIDRRRNCDYNLDPNQLTSPIKSLNKCDKQLNCADNDLLNFDDNLNFNLTLSSSEVSLYDEDSVFDDENDLDENLYDWEVKDDEKAIATNIHGEDDSLFFKEPQIFNRHTDIDLQYLSLKNNSNENLESTDLISNCDTNELSLNFSIDEDLVAEINALLDGDVSTTVNKDSPLKEVIDISDSEVYLPAPVPCDPYMDCHVEGYVLKRLLNPNLNPDNFFKPINIIKESNGASIQHNTVIENNFENIFNDLNEDRIDSFKNENSKLVLQGDTNEAIDNKILGTEKLGSFRNIIPNFLDLNSLPHYSNDQTSIPVNEELTINPQNIFFDNSGHFLNKKQDSQNYNIDAISSLYNSIHLNNSLIEQFQASTVSFSKNSNNSTSLSNTYPKNDNDICLMNKFEDQLKFTQPVSEKIYSSDVNKYLFQDNKSIIVANSDINSNENLIRIIQHLDLNNDNSHFNVINNLNNINNDVPTLIYDEMHESIEKELTDLIDEKMGECLRCSAPSSISICSNLCHECRRTDNLFRAFSANERCFEIQNWPQNSWIA